MSERACIRGCTLHDIHEIPADQPGKGRMKSALKEWWNTPEGLTLNRPNSIGGLAVNATRTTHPNGRKPQPIDLTTVDIKKVNARIAKTPKGCWEWTGRKTGEGYGLVSRGRSRTALLAHRVVYTMHRGPIPAGLLLDHLCRNHSCVNPAHLEPVTHRENDLRGYGASGLHARQTHCVNGHPFDENNTYISPKGWRRCRTCARASDRRRYSIKTLTQTDGSKA